MQIAAVVTLNVVDRFHSASFNQSDCSIQNCSAGFNEVLQFLQSQYQRQTVALGVQDPELSPVIPVSSHVLPVGLLRLFRPKIWWTMAVRKRSRELRKVHAA